MVVAVALAAAVVAFGPLVAQARELATAAPALADRLRATLIDRFGGILGPGLVRRAIGALPSPRRPWAEALARDLSISLGGYLAGLNVENYVLSPVVYRKTLGISVLGQLAAVLFLDPAREPVNDPCASAPPGNVLIRGHGLARATTVLAAGKPGGRPRADTQGRRASA